MPSQRYPQGTNVIPLKRVETIPTSLAKQGVAETAISGKGHSVQYTVWFEGESLLHDFLECVMKLKPRSIKVLQRGMHSKISFDED